MKIDKTAVLFLQKALTGSSEELLTIVQQAQVDFLPTAFKKLIWFTLWLPGMKTVDARKLLASNRLTTLQKEVVEARLSHP